MLEANTTAILITQLRLLTTTPRCTTSNQTCFCDGGSSLDRVLRFCLSASNQTLWFTSGICAGTTPVGAQQWASTSVSESGRSSIGVLVCRQHHCSSMASPGTSGTQHQGAKARAGTSVVVRDCQRLQTMSKGCSEVRTVKCCTDAA
jgi:hypothetical protein